MGTRTMLVTMVLAAGVVACGKPKPPADAKVSDALQKDLDRASLPVSELASSKYEPHFVSGIEMPEGQAPQVARAPHRPSPHPTHPHAPKRVPKAPANVDAVTVAQAEPAPEPHVDPVESPAPVEAPSPRPVPPVIPDGGVGTGDGGEVHHGGGGIGGVLGGIIGVVIRGGVVDGDACDPRGHPRRGGGTILINPRGPVAFPVPHW